MGIKSWYTAKQVIDEALFVTGDIEKKNYEMAVMFFMRGYREFKLFLSTSYTKVWLPVTPIKTIALPDDFIELVFIGTNVNGELFSFTKNSKIQSPSDPLQQTLNTARKEDDNLRVSPTWGYGAKGVNELGYFNLNEKLNRIELKQAFLTWYEQSQMSEVYLGYIGTEINDLNEAFVPLSSVNLITSYIASELELSKPKPNPFMIQMRERKYKEEASKYNALALPSADELLDAIYQTSAQSIR
jgi:hypothetical protein